MRKVVMVLSVLLAATFVSAGEPEVVAHQIRFCNDERPATKFDMPLCADYDLNHGLIEALEGGDRSALPLLQRRYEAAETYDERQLLAGVLLEHLENDAAIWAELVEQASIVLRFPVDAEFEKYCAARGATPSAVSWMSRAALRLASFDARSDELLHQALKSGNPDLITVATTGFADRRDESALPAIDRALAGAGHETVALAQDLALFESDAADAVAFKYLDDEEKRAYLEMKAERRALSEPR